MSEENKVIPFPLDDFLERREYQAIEIIELFNEEVADKARQAMCYSGEVGIPQSSMENWAFGVALKSRGCL